MDLSPPGSSVRGGLQARMLERVAISSPGNLPSPGIKPSSFVSPALAACSLPAEPPGQLPWSFCHIGSYFPAASLSSANILCCCACCVIFSACSSRQTLGLRPPVVPLPGVWDGSLYDISCSVIDWFTSCPLPVLL